VWVVVVSADGDVVGSGCVDGAVCAQSVGCGVLFPTLSARLAMTGASMVSPVYIVSCRLSWSLLTGSCIAVSASSHRYTAFCGTRSSLFSVSVSMEIVPMSAKVRQARRHR